LEFGEKQLVFGCRYARQVRGIATARRVGDERMTADEPVDNDSAGPAAAPRPPPRPGPRPGPRPQSSGSRPTAHPVPVAPRSNPHQFGRVDDDGTVWLISAAGERVVGSWQAGDREAAFAHFGRRFDDLSTEVTLMEERLAAGSGAARKIKAKAQHPRVRGKEVVQEPQGAQREHAFEDHRSGDPVQPLLPLQEAVDDVA